MGLSNLPNKLIFSIVTFLGLRELNSFCRVNRHNYALLNPLLYRRELREFDASVGFPELALFWACRTGVEGTVRLSVQAGAHIDAPNNVGQSPFSVTAEHGHVNIMKLLYDTKQVSIDSKDLCSLTPLSHAAVSGQERAVKFLLDTKQVDINCQNLNGQTPLSLAAADGQEGTVKLLLDTGEADVGRMDICDRKAIVWAAANGHEAVVKLLLNVKPIDENLGTLLFCAAAMNMKGWSSCSSA